ncbi:MAG: tetratricopeptide repeat protein [Calditrichaeota bacterium]|nr:tetratricopeptide repeat protein [Calditrichota bacterium]
MNKDQLPKPFSQKIRIGVLLVEGGLVVALAAALALGMQKVPEFFFQEKLIHIVVSEFRISSPEKDGIAKELQETVYRKLKNSLDKEGVFLDAMIVKSDSTVDSHETARRIGQRQKGSQAIVLWGDIRGNTYAPHYTLINPPEGLVTSETQQTRIIHDLNNLEGQAISLATNTLNIAGFSLGLVKYWKAEYQKAIALFEKVYKQDTSNSAIMFYMGNCYYYLDEFEKASSFYRKWINKDPESVSGLNNLAVVLMEMGEPREALMLLEKALQLDKQSVELWTNIGATYLALNEDGEAAASLASAIEIDPDNPIALSNCAVIAEKMGDYDAAKSFLERAAESPEAPARVFTNLGTINYQHFKDYNKAWEAFKKANDLVPGDTSSAFGLALVYLRFGDVDKATEWLFKTIEHSHSPARYYQQFGDAAFQAELYNPALTFYQEALNTDPGSISNYARMAQSANKLNAQTDALNYVMIYANHNPPRDEETEQTYHLGCVVAFNTGKLDTALYLCEQVYQMKPENQEYRTTYLQTLLRYAQVKRDTTILPVFLNEVQKNPPDDAKMADYLAQIATIYLEHNDLDRAIQYYERALGLNSQDELSRHNLTVTFQKQSQVLLEEKEWESAIGTLNRAFSITKDVKEKAKILYNKAFIFQEQGNREISHAQLREFINYVREQNLENDAELRNMLAEAQKVVKP